jgi:acetolactate synthase-1/2/3 large subunit
VRVYEVVAEGMARQEVRAFFGLMGDGNLKLIPYAASELGIPFYASRHEAGAVAMADGYARATGEVGVCSFTQGPGLTNAMTALVSAQRGRTPLVVLCGDTPTVVPGLPQDIEQAPILKAAGLEVQELTPDDAAGAVATAFARARSERRPIALNLPTDVQEAESAVAEPSRTASVPQTVRAPDPAALDAAAAALAGADRPVVIAGRGALAAGARDDVIALADRAGALLAHSLPLKGVFAGHPFDLGIAGGFASALAQRLIGDADCVVAIGAGLNHFTSRGGTLFGAATLIHCDADPAAFGRYVPADLTITGDARAVARALADRISQRSGYRSAEIAAAIAEPPAFSDDSDADGLDPRAVSARIDALLPRNRSLVVDGGHFMGFPATGLDVPDPSAFVCTLDFGSIGLGLGAAIGVAVGAPQRVTVAAVGDGGLMMSLGELDTAVRYRLPVVVVVYNDRAYGAEMHFLRMLGLPDEASVFAVPPLDGVARAMGAAAMAVRDLADLDTLPALVDGLDGPLVLDCRITQNVRAGWLEEAFARGTH